MCGICGAIASHTVTPFEVGNVQKLLSLNYYRGRDSTGMFDVVEINKDKLKLTGKGKHKTKEVGHPTLYWKRTDPAFLFANREMEIQRITRWTDHTLRAVVCHARAATIGKVTADNAHPFVFNNILGVHNGTISGDFKGKEGHEVDSSAIFEGIQKNGIEKTLNTLYESNGQVAYALVWLDTNTNTVYFIRNSMRPLHYLTRSGTLYFSSDKKDLSYVFDVREYSPEIKEFSTNILYSIKIDDDTTTLTEKRLDIKTSLPVYETYRGQDGWFGTSSYSPHGRPASSPAFNDDIPEHMRRNQSPLLLKDNREVRAYESHWRDKQWADFMNLGQTTYSNDHKEYDIAFGRYFTDYCFSHLQRWKKDHNIEYTKKLLLIWDNFTPKRQSEELAKCSFPPDELGKKLPPVSPVQIIDTKGNVISLEEAKEDLKFPFGVSGRKCSEEMYKQKVQHGCAQCGRRPDPKEADEVFWIDGDTFLDFDCCWDIATTKDKVKLATYDQEAVAKHTDTVSSRYGIVDYDKEDRPSVH